MSLKSGHTIQRYAANETKNFLKYFKNCTDGYIRLQPGGWYFYPAFERYANRYYEFQYKPSDVVVMTWPKCGTTWAQEIIWTMTNNPSFANPLESMAIMYRSPFLELDGLFQSYPNEIEKTPKKLAFLNKKMEFFNTICPGKDPENGILIQMAEHVPDPRVIKTHLAFSLLNPKMLDTCKVVYVARNVKDACLSYFHHHLNIEGITISLDDFIDFFVNDKLLHAPYWQHVKEGWERRNHPNLHWIFYEEMKKDPKKEIIRLNKFLGTNLSNKKLEEILNYTNFENMKERDPAFGPFKTNRKEGDKEGSFFRKGKVGDWRTSLNEEQNKKLDEWIKEKSEGLDMQFTY